MGRFSPSRLTGVFCAAFMCVALTMPASGAERVGSAAAVRGIVQLAAISGVREVGKKVASGEPIFLGDRISTGPKGRLQIMLLDETVFTIGPKAAIVIDKFVYDPSTSNGKVAATILKGTFRFVTGKVSKRDPKNMVVKLPVGSIGVRGTIVAGRVEGGVSTILLLGPGPRTNTGERVGRVIVGTRPTGGVANTVEITRPGFATTITGDKPPTPPAPIVGLLTAITSTLAPPPPPPPENGENEGPVLANEGPIDGGPGGPGPCCQLPPPPKPPIMLGFDTTYELLRSINVGTAYFKNIPPRPFTGGNGGIGTYTITYSYHFGTRTATGTVDINATSGFTTTGAGTATLMVNPFATATGPVNITENLGTISGLPGSVDINYKLRNLNNIPVSAMDYDLTYTESTTTGTAQGRLLRKPPP
jgi:hypothetical protein